MTKQSQSAIHVTGAAIEQLAGQLRHQHTMLDDGASTASCTRGKSIWATSCRSATVYWTWVITDDGSPVIADPMAILSNVQFSEPGTKASFDAQFLGINRLVHALPWQQEVRDHLARLRVPSAGRHRMSSTDRKPSRSGVAVAA
ncbi:hypothetical protein ABIC83_003002 [Roseateles asaccharophilus]|uniref:hypothetical protein n=1 Tax=Roseateles asaccharophilus TaxID=582607 RepID=UPI0038363082